MTEVHTVDKVLLKMSQRRSDEVDLCEINYLRSSLVDFCISTDMWSWLSLRRTHFSNQGLRLGPVVEKVKSALSCNIQN